MAAPAGPSDQHGAGDTVRARSAEPIAALFRALESVDGDVSPQLARSVQAQINLVKQIGREFRLLTESEARAILGLGNAADLPDLWVRYRGESRYPVFLFEPSPGGWVSMRVRPSIWPAIRQLLDSLRDWFAALAVQKGRQLMPVIDRQPLDPIHSLERPRGGAG